MARRRKPGSATRLGGDRLGDGDRGGVARALDEVAFGAARTLNLRAHLPTRAEALARAEAWLRERQAALQSGGDVLVITGRGNASVDGVSVVRAAVSELLASLRRRHVVAAYREHTAGSFVVELAPSAAVHARRAPTPPAAAPAPSPRTLAALAPETRALLRDLATIGMQHLGVHTPTRELVEDEMLRQFAALAGRAPASADREAWLRSAIADAIADLHA